MKRISQILSIAVLSLLFFTQIQAAPKVEVSESTFDFGYAPQDSKLTHKYWVKSTGDEDLKILKVVPGCGCTKAPLEKNTIASGDSTWLEIIFSSKKYSNKISKHPQFFTNVGEASERISFTTNIVAPGMTTTPLEITPFKVNLSEQDISKDMHLANAKTEIKSGDPGVVEIRNSSTEDLTVSIIAFDRDMFEIDFPTVIKAGETAKGSFKLKSSAADKSFQKSLTLEVNDEAKTRFTIPVVYNSKIMSQN